MTNMDKRNDHGRLDDNLDRLIKLGEPAPRMPEDLKARIRSELIVMESESVKRQTFFGRWAFGPLAAAMLLAAMLIVFWPTGSPSTISWADVLEHLEQIRTVTLTSMSYVEITTPAGKRINGRSKVYHKDPGLSRIETYVPDSDLDTTELELITIMKREPGLMETLSLYPARHLAIRKTYIYRNNGSEPASQPEIDLASRNWELFKEITADKTKRIGNRAVGGMPAVGFTFELPREYIPSDADGDCRGQLWASREDAIPLFVEWGYRNIQGQNVRHELSDIQWNVPLDESLFDLIVPTGWGLNRTQTESTEYTGTTLAPGVTLKISPDGQEPLAADGDVAGVIQVIQTTDPGSNIPETTQLTIDLKPAAAKRLHDYADAHPDKIFVVDFNEQTKVAVKLDASHPTQISINLNWLHISLAELETKYFTTSIERKKNDHL